MPAPSTGSHPSIVYLSESGALQTTMKSAQLIRYDTITKNKTILLSFAQSAEEISDAQISTNGQWILMLTGSISESQTELQLIRSDGQLLQTLFCAPAYEIGNIRWSPDSQQVAFAVSAPNGRVSTIQVLDLTSTQQETFTASNYRPYAWLDNTRLYIIQPQGNLLTSPQLLSLLDTRHGTLNSWFVSRQLLQRTRSAVHLRRVPMARNCSPVPALQWKEMAVGDLRSRVPAH